MYKLGLILAVLALSATAAHAISRYDTKRLSCSRIQAILKSEGTAILRYPSPRNSSITLYDTYVARGGYCPTGGYSSSATVPASDTNACRVYRCNKKRGGGR